MKAIRLPSLKTALGIVCLFAVCLLAVFTALHAPDPRLVLTTLALVPLLGVTAPPETAEEIQKTLKEIGAEWGKLKELPGEVEKLTLSLGDFTKQFKLIRAGQLAEQRHIVRTTGQISENAAANLAAHCLLARIKADATHPMLDGKQRDFFGGVVREVLGVEVKTALSSSDIPLPVEYSGDVAELVSSFGAARRYGTVYPLGGSSTKLPRLKTDPTFGLIAGSGTVTEKSPQTEWVTFTPEKFGGLIRLPSELDADSIVPLGQFIARYAARQMAYVEDYNFFRSTGAGSGLNGSVEGLFKSVVTNSKTVALASGDLAAADITLAKVRAMRPVVDAAALGMSAYYFHPSFEHKFSTFNTAGDKPYQANGLNGASLDGFPIRWVDALPAFSSSDSASTVYGLFGDVSWQYLGLRGGMRFDTSEQAAFTTDEILIRALERLTIGLMATGAVAGIITAAS